MNLDKIIRINKVLRELNISLERAIDIFKDGNIYVESNPNTKISQFEYDYLKYRLNFKEKVVISLPQITNPEIAKRIRQSKGIP
jgi:hypothetical protein